MIYTDRLYGPAELHEAVLLDLLKNLDQNSGKWPMRVIGTP